MNAREMRQIFQETYQHRESALLHFYGVDGWDVYNCSIPFYWEGKHYLFGRVERRGEWMRSFVRLFEECGRDKWALVPDSMTYQMEDPYITQIGRQLVLGGTRVKVKAGKLDTYYGDFYKGQDLHDLYYFTSGPNDMKDIRLVELRDGRIGVFSRPRGKDILARYGSESMLGFRVISSLDELTEEAILSAPYFPDLFGPGEWGGCNQAYLLECGKIGVIGHIGYLDNKHGIAISSYINISFVLDPDENTIEHLQVIGTRDCYPPNPSKLPDLTDCAFSSGIVEREDGLADLYSGIGDCAEARIVIPYPFEGYGKIARGNGSDIYGGIA